MARFLELAKQQKEVVGQLHAAELSRLQEALRELGVSGDGKFEVSYRIQGTSPRYFGETALPMLVLEVQTDLPLVCQRCFSPMPQRVDLRFEYALCHEPPEALLEDEQVDWLEEGDEATVEALVEDELLMALPIAVMHETECVNLQQTAGEKPNPFAALKQLKLDK